MEQKMWPCLLAAREVRSSRAWLKYFVVPVHVLLLLGTARGNSFALLWEVVAAHGVGEGEDALRAPVGSPRAIALGGQGQLYIADTRHVRIRRVANGRISTLAGTGATGYNGDGIPAATARLNFPTAVAVGPDGTVYVADQQNHRIRAIGADGLIRTVAGDGRQGFGGDGGPATAARLNGVSGLAVDASGVLYVADSGNHRLRRITPDGRIATVAGTGEPGHAGDGGAAARALLRYPTFVALDGRNTVYVYDSGNRAVRRIDPEGVIAATGIEGIVDGLAADPAGTVYYSQYGNVWAFREGRPQIIAGRAVRWLGGSLALESVVAQPAALAVDGSGNLFIADPERAVLVEIHAGGAAARVAGNGTPARYGDGGPAHGASFACGNLLVTEDGTIFFTDVANDRLAVVRPDGRIETYGGSAAPNMNGPAGLAKDGRGNIYVADFGHHRVLRFEASGSFSIVAGSGEQGFSGDGGMATEARLDGPGGLAVDAEGHLYISDSRNLRVRRVDANGVITTVAGNGEDGEAVDGAQATKSPLGRPRDLAVTIDGELLVAVASGEAVRRVTPDGAVYTHRLDAAIAPLLQVAAHLGKGLLLQPTGGAQSLRVERATLEALTADFAAPAGPGRLGGVAFDAGGQWLYACDMENRRILRARLGSGN